MLKNTFLSALLSGLCISLGGGIFLVCANNTSLGGFGKVLGAILFSVALLTICMEKLYLFTGKVGYFAIDYSLGNLKMLLVGLLGNLIGVVCFGTIMGFASDTMYKQAVAVCNAKLEMNLLVALFFGFMCGVLMYIAVNTYKSNNTFVGIIFCIPVFILSGYEHSIADMFYFATARAYSFNTLWFMLLVIIGNALGGMIIPFVKKFIKE